MEKKEKDIVIPILVVYFAMFIATLLSAENFWMFALVGHGLLFFYALLLDKRITDKNNLSEERKQFDEDFHKDFQRFRPR